MESCACEAEALKSNSHVIVGVLVRSSVRNAPSMSPVAILLARLTTHGLQEAPWPQWSKEHR